MARKQCNRSRFDIIHDILSYISEEGLASKTHILYATNLNTRSLEKFIDELIKIEAITVEKVGDRILYAVTPKGSRILDLIAKLKTMLSHKNVFIKHRSEYDIILDTLKTKINPNPYPLIRRDVLFRGESGLKYRIKYLYNNESFIVNCIGDDLEDEEIASVCSRMLLLLSDTGLNCLFLLSRRYEYLVKSVNKLLSRHGYRDRVRLVFI